MQGLIQSSIDNRVQDWLEGNGNATQHDNPEDNPDEMELPLSFMDMDTDDTEDKEDKVEVK